MSTLDRRALVLGLGAAALFVRTGSAQPFRAPESLAPLVRQVLPAVVNIAVIETIGGPEALAQMPPEWRGTPLERQFRQRRQQVRGGGSGFIIDPSGLIVTNNHVAGRAGKVTVSLQDGTELDAALVGADELTDIALLRVRSPRPLPVVRWGDSRAVEVGDWIIAAGNPYGLGGSISAGIVSARGRDLGAGPFDDFIQIDAPINPGNSGGPTFNMRGEVIGVNTAILSPTGGSVGIGFAVPSELAQRVVAELRERGRVERGWLGVTISEPAGRVVIAGVDPRGPAARAGLRTGDTVLALNGEEVMSGRGLIRAVASASPGSSVRLRVRREARTLDVNVTIGRRPTQQEG
jgi:serine protease Do